MVQPMCVLGYEGPGLLGSHKCYRFRVQGLRLELGFWAFFGQRVLWLALLALAAHSTGFAKSSRNKGPGIMLLLSQGWVHRGSPWSGSS